MRGEVALVYCLVASCVWLVHGTTDAGDVAALNKLFSDWDSNPALIKWVDNAGDPCGDRWFGITCVGMSVTEIKLPNIGLAGKVKGSVLLQFLHLTVLDLSFNAFDNDIPERFPFTLVDLDLSNNKFQGSFPNHVMHLPRLKTIKLHNNKLDGELNPRALKLLVTVVTLDLSNNKFKGPIPAAMGDYMLNLKYLYLQRNKFTGIIPASFAKLVALQVCDLSDNKLTGYIPPNFKPATFSYHGNKIIEPAPPPPPGTPRAINPPGLGSAPLAASSASSSSSKVAAIVVGVLVVLAVAALLVWFFFLRKTPERGTTERLDVEASNHKHSGRSFCIWCLPVFSTGKEDEMTPAKVKVSDLDTTENRTDSPKIKAQPPKKTLTIRLPVVNLDVDSPKIKRPAGEERLIRAAIPATAFTVAELQSATRSFSESVLLGSGSHGQVYRADFPDGRVLAVKKLDFEDEEGFLLVVDAVARLRNGGVVALVGYCADHGQRLLVYEYVSRGTLHAALHGDQTLSWNVRIKIALGAARALEYLHDVCSPPVAHRNFTSSNILLDDEILPHLSDCGLEALVSSVIERQVAAQRLGASGYSPPEYTMLGAYTTKSDVYSFGVVMLELLTGRQPSDSSRPRSEQSLVRWATPQLHDIEALVKMVDPALRGVYPAMSLSCLADVIALCVQPEPEFRPPMSEVVQSLERLMQRATLGNL